MSFEITVILFSDTDVKNNNIRYSLFYEDLRKVFNVEIWDGSKIYLNRRFLYTGSNSRSDGTIVVINSLHELNEQIKSKIKNGERVIILHSMVLESYLKVSRIFEKNAIRSICVDSETYARWVRHRYFYLFRSEMKMNNRIKATIQNNTILQGLFYLIRYRARKFDYSFSSVNCIPQTNKNFARSHYQNYDSVIDLRSKKGRIIENKYALFVDTAFATHPGWEKFEDKPDADEYFRQVRDYLDAFEEKTGIKTIIAGYPKVQVETCKFGNRPVIYGKTPELIRDAELIFMHSSSTIMICIALKKPIIFLYDEKWRTGNTRSFYYESKYYATMLGAPWIEINKKTVPKYVIDKGKYDDMIASYIVYRGHEDEKNSELLVQLINELVLVGRKDGNSKK